MARARTASGVFLLWLAIAIVAARALLA